MTDVGKNQWSNSIGDRGILEQMSAPCIVYHLGMIPYQRAWEIQDALAGQIAVGEHPPTLLLLEHPHVFTFGRSGNPANLLWEADELKRRGISALWVDRGGDVTYHGPGQLIGYPLLPLAPGGVFAGESPSGSSASPNSLPRADLIDYLRKLELVLIQVLDGYHIPGIRLEGKTGVWIPSDASGRGCPAKIASIGVKVDARGVSRHGFALNVSPDMSYWEGIIACGLAGSEAVSLAELLHPIPDMFEVENAVKESFAEVFHYEMVASNWGEEDFDLFMAGVMRP